jgi:GNAT superfamily N-acetyltransferase
MTTTRRPKCRSSVIPCPAGERCPEHRGIIKAIAQATENQDLGNFLTLNEEKASKEELQKRAEFLSQTRIRRNRKGDIVVKTPGRKTTVAEFTANGRAVSVTKQGKTQTQVIPAPHPAELVDKQRRIMPAERGIMNSNRGWESPDHLFQKGVDAVYDGHVQVSTNWKNENVLVDGIRVDDDYQGHGVESHVLASIVLNTRVGMHDIYGSTKIPYEAYKENGFEPNPYHWAGKTHPETGFTYPPKEQLDALTDRDKHHDTINYSGLYDARSNEEYPYVRQVHGRRFTDHNFIPSQQPGDRETSLKISRLQGEREQRLHDAIGTWGKGPGKIDLH